MQNFNTQVLVTLYNAENKFLNCLVQLDATMDALRAELEGVSADDLNKQVKEFVQMSDELNESRENAFFTVFDRLVHEGSGGRAPRNSSLVLEITPQWGKKLTKVLTAAKPVAGSRKFLPARGLRLRQWLEEAPLDGLLPSAIW